MSLFQRPLSTLVFDRSICHIDAPFDAFDDVLRRNVIYLMILWHGGTYVGFCKVFLAGQIDHDMVSKEFFILDFFK